MNPVMSPVSPETAFAMLIDAIPSCTVNDLPQPVLAYLQETRALSTETVEEALRRRFLLLSKGEETIDYLLDHVDDDILQAAGFLSKKYFFHFKDMPLLFPFPDRKSVAFRDVRSCKHRLVGKQYSAYWYWKASNGNQVAICEGAMDLLSLVDMGFAGHVIALRSVASAYGDNAKEILNEISSRFTEGDNEVLICLDNDEPGIAAQSQLSEMLKNAEIPYRCPFLPNIYKDINEALVQVA